MDMTGKKRDTVWLFNDDQTAKSLPLTATFVDCAEEISKDGASKFPVITVESAGTKYKLSQWRTECDGCIGRWGKDSDLWKGKLVTVDINRKGKFTLTPAELEVAQ